MSDRKTINLIPPEQRHHCAESPLPSAVATGGIVLFFLVVGLLFSSEEAAPLVSAAAPVPIPVTDECRVEFDDPLSYSLARADHWVPWGQLFAELPEFLEDIGTIKTLEYRRDRGTLEIAGQTEGIHQLPELMLFLEKYSWLKEPVPVQVNRDPATGRSNFSIKVDVSPALTLEETP